MIREIEFRGLCLDTGDFVYGYYVANDDYHTIAHKSPDDAGMIRIHEVDGKTVGQFTGLLDRNGVKIFEGDTAKTPCGHAGTVMLSGASFYVEDYDSGDYYQGQNPDSWDWSKFEVIGNIHQNSELMK